MSWDSRPLSRTEVSEEHWRSEGKDRPCSGLRRMTELFEEDSSDGDETAWAVIVQLGRKTRGCDTHAVLGCLLVVQGRFSSQRKKGGVGDRQERNGIV